MPERSIVRDDDGKPIYVREVDDDGRASRLYEYDGSILSDLYDHKGDLVELADHDRHGNTKAYEADNSVLATLLAGGYGAQKGSGHDSAPPAADSSSSAPDESHADHHPDDSASSYSSGSSGSYSPSSSETPAGSGSGLGIALLVIVGLGYILYSNHQTEKVSVDRENVPWPPEEVEAIHDKYSTGYNCPLCF